jgi:hypothetical protein
MLHQLGCLLYSPPLESHIRRLQPIKSGSTWEIELRGASIWCVELIKQEIERKHPESRIMHSSRSIEDQSDTAEEEETKHGENGTRKPAPGDFGINAILIDFFLYDTMKQLESDRRETIPHHRTRSIWY